MVVPPGWGAAYEQDDNATAFLSPEWVWACATAFPGTLFAGFDDDGSFGLSAITLRNSAGARVLGVSASHDLADYTDLLLHPRQDAPERMIEVFLGIAGVDVVEFAHTPPWANAWRVAAHWPGPVVHVPSSECPRFDGGRLVDYLQMLPSRRRKDLRRKHRKLEQADVTWELVPSDPVQVMQAVRQMLEWHAIRWQGSGLNRLHTTGEFRDFLVSLAVSGRGRILCFRSSGSVMGCAYFLTDDQWARNYLVAYSPTVGASLSHDAAEVVAGFETFGPLPGGLDFLRGAHAEKLRFSTSMVRNRQLLLVRPGSARGHAYAAYVMGRNAARPRLRSGRERLIGLRRSVRARAFATPRTQSGTPEVCGDGM